MPKNHPIFRSFAAGELSPRMYSRTDTSAWNNGLAKCLNAVCTSHGPAVRRSGSRYIGASDGNIAAKVIGFKVSPTLAYFIAITETEIVIMNVSAAETPVVEQRIAMTVWDADEIADIQFDSPPEDFEIWLVHQNVQPHELTFDGDEAPGSRWELDNINFTNTPDDWGGQNQPSVIVFHEGRSWFMSTPDQQQHMWASRSGSYKNFTTGSNAADSLVVILAQRGRIEWAVSAQTLVVGAANGEHIVSSEGGVIIPNDVQVTHQSSYGSTSVQAKLIGNITMYVSPDGRKLRDIGYQFDENNYLSRDITFLSEHITLLNSIKELTWSQQPDNLIWCVTHEGNVLGCTYERSHDIIGWHAHDTQGKVLSLDSVDIVGNSFVLYAADRGGGQITFELDDFRTFMDASEDVEPDVDLKFMVPRLADQTVQVTVGNAIHPDVELDGSGEGQLQYTTDPGRPEDVVTVGLGYVTELQTLPLDYTPEEPGTSMHFMKRWNKIYVRILNSAKPEIGKVGEVGRPPERHPQTPMNLPEPNRNEDVKVIGLGWDRFSQVYIRQDLPLPLTVTGIFGEMSQEVDED